MAPEPAVHPLLEPLTFLLGRWEGISVALWVPGGGLRFREALEVSHSGRPALAYRQQTWHEDGTPSHGEAGYIAVSEDGSLTLTVAQPSGIVEIHTGTLEGTSLRFTCTAVALAPSARPVTAVERSLSAHYGILTSSLRVAMNGEPLADHIKGTLHRVEAAA